GGPHPTLGGGGGSAGPGPLCGAGRPPAARPTANARRWSATVPRGWGPSATAQLGPESAAPLPAGRGPAPPAPATPSPARRCAKPEPAAPRRSGRRGTARHLVAFLTLPTVCPALPLSARHAPQPQGAVGVRREDALAVGGEGDANPARGVALEALQFLARGNLPQPHDTASVTGRDGVPAVGRDGYVLDGGVVNHLPQFPARPHVPDAQRRVVAAGDDCLALGQETHHGYLVGVALEATH